MKRPRWPIETREHRDLGRFVRNYLGRLRFCRLATSRFRSKTARLAWRHAAHATNKRAAPEPSHGQSR